MESNKIVKGFTWTAIERFSIQFVQFLLGIIIARLISPNEYGVLGILMVFINISQVFVDSGLGNALIYYNNLKKEDVQTTFTFNLIISTLIYIILFITAPSIELFYNLPNLSLYVKTSSVVLLINSLIIVPTVQLKVRLNFKALAISNLCSTVLSGLIGVIFAYNGYGIWALIIQLLTKSFFQFIFLIIQCKWIPNLSFHKKSFRKLYKFGINIFSASCFTKIVDEGTIFLIGKIIAPYSLGLYTRANQFASLPSTSIGNIVSSVIFPSLSSIKDNPSEFNKIYLKSIKYQGLLSIPIFLILVMVSEPMVRLVLTDKWIGAVPILQILAFGRILSPTTNITEQALNAKGRSDLFLKQQTLKLTVKIILILIALPFGIIYIALADAIFTLSQFFITNYYGRKVIGFPILRLFTIIFPFILTGLISLAVGYFSTMAIQNDIAKICIGLFSYISTYISILIIFYDKNIFNFLLNKIKPQILLK